MHKYLRSIGYGCIKSRTELNKFLKTIENDYTCHELVSLDEEADFCEYQKEYGQFMGITVCGELDEEDNFDPAYYFPYFEGSGVTTYADISVERKIEKEQYVGMCEDSKIGISLIFTLRNGIDYMREKQAGFTSGLTTSVTFSGLALSGMILLPVVKNERQRKNEQAAADSRQMLLNAARNGD